MSASPRKRQSATKMRPVVKGPKADMQAKQHLNPGSPNGEKRAVATGRRPNTVYRKREHLTPAEVAKLIDTARCNRYGQRDATMVLLAYRHGFRASEVCDLEWSAINFARAEMHVSRRKAGKPATHPIRGDELRELRKRGAPFTPASFNWVIKRAGQKAGLPFQVHAHMLRHSAGYKLAGDGHDTRSIQDYLGHQDIGTRFATRRLKPIAGWSLNRPTSSTGPRGRTCLTGDHECGPEVHRRISVLLWPMVGHSTQRTQSRQKSRNGLGESATRQTSTTACRPRQVVSPSRSLLARAN